jgi:hypothetical protein
LDDPFHYNKRAIDFYQQHMNRVYDKKDCLVPTEICAILFKDRLLVKFPLLFISSANFRFLSRLGKALLIKSNAGVFLSTKSGGNINHLEFYLMAHQVRILIPLSTLFLKSILQNIIYT